MNKDDPLFDRIMWGAIRFVIVPIMIVMLITIIVLFMGWLITSAVHFIG